MTLGEIRQLRWGILSTARIAPKVRRAMKRAEGSDAVAVASRSLERAQRWAAEHDVTTAYGSYEALLEDADVDAVYIALPPSMHAEWTIRAAEAGKHVLCEKPLAASLQEAEEMIAACRQQGVQLMDGVMWRHHERTAAMRRQLDSGALGRLRRMTSAFTLNWDPLPKDNIRFQRDLAGGVLGDLGWYCVGATLWAFEDLPTRVWATARYFEDVEVNLSGLMWFDGDRVASFDCGYDTALRKWFEIAGTEGSLVCDDFVLPQDESRARYWTHDADGTSQEHVIERSVQEVRMIERFSELVRSGTFDDSWPAESVRVQRVCDALGVSALLQEPVDLRE